MLFALFTSWKKDAEVVSIKMRKNKEAISVMPELAAVNTKGFVTRDHDNKAPKMFHYTINGMGYVALLRE
jgi:hypothetical protein